MIFRRNETLSIDALLDALEADEKYVPTEGEIQTARADVAGLRTFLASIATAEPQTDQAKWLVTTAQEGLGWRQIPEPTNRKDYA